MDREPFSDPDKLLARLLEACADAIRPLWELAR
jgi:hypothetical protein